MSNSIHPPKPRFALAIGVIGHRPDRLPDPSSYAGRKIVTDVGRVLDEVAREAVSAHGKHKALFASDPSLLSLVSTLAEGTDHIVAEAALSRGFVLDAPLPFAVETYSSDFKLEMAKQAFEALRARARAVLPLPGQRGAADDDPQQAQQKEGRSYEAAGLAVLSQSDLVLAVWDGGESHGRGGSTDMLNAAARLRLPIIHIDANGKDEPRILGGSSDGVWLTADTVEDLTPIKLGKGLPKLIDDLVRPPISKPDQHKHLGLFEWCMLMLHLRPLNTETDALRNFLVEGVRARNFRVEFPLLTAMVGARAVVSTDYRPKSPQQLAGYLTKLAPPASTGAPSTENLIEAFGWADATGIFFAQVFRSAVVANFALASLAVVLAAISVLREGWKPYLAGLEVMCIGLILFNTGATWRKGWHRRWFEARELAERLRAALPLWALGVRPTTFFGQEPTWTGWYARAIVRGQGLRHVAPAQDWVAEAQSTLEGVLEDQCAYHGRSAEAMGKLERRLEDFGFVLFLASFVSSLAALIGVVLLGWMTHEPVLVASTALSTGLPAVASAIFAIRVIGDYGGIARRSERTRAALTQLLSAMKEDMYDQRALRLCALAAAEAMLGDVASWRLATESRSLDIP